MASEIDHLWGGMEELDAVRTALLRSLRRCSSALCGVVLCTVCLPRHVLHLTARGRVVHALAGVAAAD
jgi:hypothetical protein